VEKYTRREITLLKAYYKFYIKIINDRLKAQAENFLLDARMDSEKQVFHLSIVKHETVS
jgi:hypothetical protein